ncbi:class I SAM-dependent methyltransferase [Qipengyuania sp. YIM B01966]|uniref:class I SAM-dependent methyltransferase n=1 Tax=Qipengyuania sp. YIM B01966 TaxID=2778646 RepID=UPI0018F513F4|nr:hypothetical protein [Qipengyuania sp. YIM B01966]
MRIEEAREITSWIRSLNLPAGTVCLNVGSSTGHFRTQVQPHIEKFLFAPLRADGLHVVHCDLKAAEGVDEVGDLLDPEFRKHLKRHDARILICSNLLEHLTEPQTFADSCADLVSPGGHAIVTVPRSYPYHPDPIDTMFRPAPEDLARMFADWAVERQQVLVSGNYADDLRASGRGAEILAKQVLRTLLPVYRPSQWRHIAHRLLWLWRPYTLSMVLLQKPAS